MRTCREVRRYLQRASSESRDRRLREHLTACPRCARLYHLRRVERALLQATLPGEGAPEPSPDFPARLMARWRQSSSGEKWTFWEFVWNFSKLFAVITMIVLIVIGGMNWYTTDRQERRPVLVNDLIPPPADEVDFILSEDVALTQERVLRTLVVVREENNGNRQ